MKGKYDPVLKVMPETEHRGKVFFRVAGDEFLEVGYGTEEAVIGLKEMLLNIFRVRMPNRLG